MGAARYNEYGTSPHPLAFRKIAVSKSAVEAEIEKFRQIVIGALTSSEMQPQADACLERLNAMFQKNRELFTKEDVRFVNSIRGIFAQRIAKYKPKGGPYAQKGKRRGDELTQCWRCETPVDERFTEICDKCSEPKGYKYRICPICSACGCQRAQNTLV